MRDLPDSGQTSPSSSWVLLRPLLGTASTCLYRISSSSWASRQGLLFLEMPRHSPLLMDLDINDLFAFFFILEHIWLLRFCDLDQKPILPHLEQVHCRQVLSVLSLCFSLPLFVATQNGPNFWEMVGGEVLRRSICSWRRVRMIEGFSWFF